MSRAGFRVPPPKSETSADSFGVSAPDAAEAEGNVMGMPGDTQGLANSFGSAVGGAVEDAANGDFGQIKAQLSQLLTEAHRIMADAARLGIPHNINIGALESAAMTENPQPIDISNALQASDSARQLDATVTQQALVQGATDGLGALTGMGLMGGLASLGHETFKNIDIQGAMPGMKHLISAEMNNLENGFGARVVNYSGLDTLGKMASNVNAGIAQLGQDIGLG